MDYYREHGRRLRRKRSRPANTSMGQSSIGASLGLGGLGIPSANNIGADGTTTSEFKGLSTQAANVRYEYKAAVFAEMRGEIEVALKHYEDCYASLYDLFLPSAKTLSSNTGMSASFTANISSSNGNSTARASQLQPRTKRWAEARVLADCISFKISKMYLYGSDPTHAMAQYKIHIKVYSNLAREHWNMGQDSFEHWSWEGKQCVIL